MSDVFPREVVRQVIVAASGLPDHAVYWDKDPVGMPYPYQGQVLGVCVLSMTNDSPLGTDEYIGDFDPTAQALHTYQTSTGVATITGLLKEFGTRNAEDTFRLIRRKLDGPLARRTLRAANISVNTPGAILYRPLNYDTKTISAAVFEFKLNWAYQSEITDELGKSDGTDGWIQTVTPLTGTYNP